MSEEAVLNSGAPQGYVLSPMLLSIYTNHMNLQTAVTCLFKFADDMAFVGLLLNEDLLATYFSHVSLLDEWCKESFLEMNVCETSELGLDARKTANVFVPVKVTNEPVEAVSSFKYLGTLNRYLGTLTDNRLGFNDKTELYCES